MLDEFENRRMKEHTYRPPLIPMKMALRIHCTQHVVYTCTRIPDCIVARHGFLSRILHILFFISAILRQEGIGDGKWVTIDFCIVAAFDVFL